MRAGWLVGIFLPLQIQEDDPDGLHQWAPGRLTSVWDALVGNPGVQGGTCHGTDSLVGQL